MNLHWAYQWVNPFQRKWTGAQSQREGLTTIIIFTNIIIITYDLNLVCFDSITECIVESNEESVISLPDLINKDKDEINVNSMNPSPSDVSSAKRLNVWPQQEVFNFVLSDLLSQEFTRLTSFR